MPKGGEQAWVESLVGMITELVRPLSADGVSTAACWGHKLAYTHEIDRYDANDDPTSPPPRRYETDLLVYDEATDGGWIPRVVIECKVGSVTTHDALTYSSKAATHKHVHPYLRYGILVGGWEGGPLPARLVRHGAYFDFMAVFDGTDLTPDERAALGDILLDEVRASRSLQNLLSDRTAGRPTYRILHRPLRLTT
jgi:hypothetical protein